MPLKDSDYAEVEAQLRAIFYDIVFRPVVEVVGPADKAAREASRAMRRSTERGRRLSEMRNAAPEDPVVAALKAGAIQWSPETGTVSGKFNVAVSSALKRLGAKFDRRSGTFDLPAASAPPAVRAAAHMAREAAERVHGELLRRLSDLEHSLDDLVDEKVNKRTLNATVVIAKTKKGYDKVYGDALGAMELSEENRERLREDYVRSLKPYIKKFSRDSILELREAVEKNAQAGWRFDKLVTRIQGRYDVSKSKATFLARQETSIFVHTVRRARFSESGVTEYVWRTAGDSRVREDHRHLNGNRFHYENPPVVDAATGRRGNPGFDFNCRCSDEPILPSISSVMAKRENSAPAPSQPYVPLSTEPQSPELQECIA